MSVIQDIREKYAKWAVVAIALSLLGFIMMDAFSGRGGLFNSGGSTTLGSVNGTKIDYLEFEKKVKLQEESRQSQGQQVNEATRMQIVQSTWDQEVTRLIMEDEFSKLGFAVGAKELNDILFGNNPPQDLAQQFTDPQTGIYDAAAAQQFINQLKRSPNQADRDQLEGYLANLETNKMMEKYNSLLTNSIYYPKWLIEKQNTESSGLAKISYIRYGYDKIADSAVKITDKEIEEYVSKHKDQFKQSESRSINYVMFDAAPTAADSAGIRDQLSELKDEFASGEDHEAFIARYSSNPNFEDKYVLGSKMQMPFADSIKKLSDGQVFGPYIDYNTYSLAKMIGRKSVPDSVKVRHILIKVADRQAGQLRDDSTAKKLADSIMAAVAAGADFNQLVLQYSEDEGSKNNKGEYEFSSTSNLVKNFYETAFYEPAGTKKVVKGESGDYIGYHYIEVLQQRLFETAYKVAYLSKPIVASPDTENEAANKANMFAGENRDLKSFNAAADTMAKQGILKMVATGITPEAFAVDGIPGTSRPLVRAIYDAKKGDVLQPILVGDKYVVAAVTEEFEEGTMNANAARSQVEPILRNKKKAEEIRKKIGTVTTLEEASAKLGLPIEMVDSLRFSGNSPLGFEYRVIGAAFNPANTGKVITEPITGTNGVYIVRVDNLTATPVEAANVEEQKKAMQATARNRISQQMMYGQGPAGVLRNAAKIKDKRGNFY